jgi:hypothetical protein
MGKHGLTPFFLKNDDIILCVVYRAILSIFAKKSNVFSRIIQTLLLASKWRSAKNLKNPFMSRAPFVSYDYSLSDTMVADCNVKGGRADL